MRILVSGGTGFMGQAVCDSFRVQGHEVTLLSRNGGPGRLHWNPAQGTMEKKDFSEYEVVIHLAGERIFGRWNSAKMKRIRQSRVKGTEMVARACAASEQRPGCLVMASAIGYYGDRGNEELTESSTPGNNFLAEVTQAWEDAAEPAVQAGIRVVPLRFGIVLHPEGGALRQMLPAFRAGLGGRLGSGEQWISWISLRDVIQVIHRVVSDETVEGPINVVSPQPVQNKELTRALGQVLKRPTVIPVPAPALRLLFGDMADEALLSSARVLPARLQAIGFNFQDRDLVPALQGMLGR